MSRAFHRLVVCSALLLFARALPGAQDAGRVLYYSKIDDGVVPLISAPEFGVSAAALGDLDGDGTLEVAVGAHDSTNFGSVWILSLGSAGDVVSSREIYDGVFGFNGTVQSGDSFGIEVAALGDLDKDGVPDLAVGAHNDDGAGTDRGTVWILFMNTDGTVASSVELPPVEAVPDGARFGFALTGLGDLDGDGIVDLAVGANEHDDGVALSKKGVVYILFMNADGSVREFTRIDDGVPALAGEITATANHFGSSLAVLPDTDGPGGAMLTLAVGHPGDDPNENQEGSVRLLGIDASGGVVSHVEISEGSGFTGPTYGGDWFGYAMANVGDIDGNGVDDLAVGSFGDGQAGPTLDYGEVWILLMSPSLTVIEETRITRTSAEFAADPANQRDFFTVPAALGDLDGDGRRDMLVGSWGHGGGDKGAVFVLFLDDGTIDPVETTTWEGQFSSDWGTMSNWSNGLPTSVRTAIIAPGNPNDPTAPTQTVHCDGLVVLPSAQLTIDQGNVNAHGWATIQGDVLGTGTLRMEGGGRLGGNGNIERLFVKEPSTVGGDGLTVNNLEVANDLTFTGTTLIVDGSAALTNGVLSGPGTLDLNGPVIFGMTATDPPDLLIGSTLTIDNSLGGFQPTSGKVVFDGVGAQAPQHQGFPQTRFWFHDLEIGASASVTPSDAFDVFGEAMVDGDLNIDDIFVGEALGGGGGITGSGCGTVKLGGSAIFSGVMSGVCMIDVESPTGGTLVFDVAGGLPGTLKLLGGTTLEVRNNPLSVNGDVILQDGDLKLFDDLSLTGMLNLVDGTLSTQGVTTVTAASVSVSALSDILVPASRSLALAGNPPVTVFGDVDVREGGILKFSASTVSIESGGLLKVVGTPVLPAEVVGESGGNYDLSLKSGSTIEAMNFRFEEMASAGVTIDLNAAIAPSPRDLRNGVFDKASSGGTLLTIARSAPEDFRYLMFEDSTLTAAKTVALGAGSSSVSMTNWGGTLGGGNSDPGVVWASEARTTLVPGSLRTRSFLSHVKISWTTSVEEDVHVFLVKRALAPGGPYSTIGEVADSGPGAYSFLDRDLPFQTKVYYLIHEELTHGEERAVGTTSMGMAVAQAPVGAQGPRAPVRWVGDLTPSLPLTASSARSLNKTIREATGEVLTVGLAPGSIGSFEIELGGDGPRHLRLMPSSPGSVLIDASEDPVRLNAKEPDAVFELVDLVIDIGSRSGPALVFEGPGIALLERVTLQAAAGGPAIVARAGGSLQLEDTLVHGDLGVLADGTRIVALGGRLGSIEDEASARRTAAECDPTNGESRLLASILRAPEGVRVTCETPGTSLIAVWISRRTRGGGPFMLERASAHAVHRFGGEAIGVPEQLFAAGGTYYLQGLTASPSGLRWTQMETLHLVR